MTPRRSGTARTSRGPASITTPPRPGRLPYVYCHVFVVLGLLATHPARGVVALPLLSRLYVRKADLPAIDPRHRPEFRTKLQMAVELLRWAQSWLDLLGLPIWVVADGAYAKRGFLKPAKSLGMTVVSRLRRDAALRTLPGPKPPGRRGPAPTYGPDAIDLAKRAGQRRGWSTGTFELYGEDVVKPLQDVHGDLEAGRGAIRVVLVDEPKGWRAYFCTDTRASVAEILGMVADRFSLEIAFRDCKQVVGAGQQQVRLIRANVGSFHICLWTFTLTEAWAWSREDGELVDRSASPWDSPSRRPSHADKRRAWRHALLGEEIRAVLRPGATEEEIQAVAARLLSLAA
ncbi:IS701 family transposase [Singulisphaera sp. PoT]|uniref:IS701 family transposase n=1 Tax=Singulisphaera sp. PoT TaxID=3411797 RepID=UPI003BF5C265